MAKYNGVEFRVDVRFDERVFMKTEDTFARPHLHLFDASYAEQSEENIFLKMFKSFQISGVYDSTTDEIVSWVAGDLWTTNLPNPFDAWMAEREWTKSWRLG